MNPYAPPKAEPAEKPEAFPLTGRRLASRGKRLGAALVDAVAMFVVGTVLSRTFCAIASVEPSTEIARVAMLTATVPQWMLIATRGQTIGKILFKMEIVLVDGTPARFLHGVVLRNWPILFVSVVPPLVIPALKTVSMLLTGVDPLFIFRADQRCMHDWIAGTIVVDKDS